VNLKRGKKATPSPLEEKRKKRGDSPRNKGLKRGDAVVSLGNFKKKRKENETQHRQKKGEKKYFWPPRGTPRAGKRIGRKEGVARPRKGGKGNAQQPRLKRKPPSRLQGGMSKQSPGLFMKKMGKKRRGNCPF